MFVFHLNRFSLHTNGCHGNLRPWTSSDAPYTEAAGEDAVKQKGECNNKYQAKKPRMFVEKPYNWVQHRRDVQASRVPAESFGFKNQLATF